MQEANKEKIRNLINRTFRSLPTANDLPRLLRCIHVYNGTTKVFPREASQEGSDNVDLLFRLLQELCKAIGDKNEEELVTETFDKYFQHSPNNTFKKAETVSTVNPALREALATLPHTFLAGNEHGYFWFALDKPNLDLFIQINGKELKIEVGTPSSQQEEDCKLSCSTANFISIISGELTVNEAHSQGIMIISDKDKLSVLAKSFNFHHNILKVKTPMVKSSSTEAVVPLNSAIGKYFEEAIGDDKVITKIIKACNQATISPAIIELKTALGKQYMTKDVKNGWIIDYIVQRDKNLVVMKSRKTEQHIQDLFQYIWQLQISFDINNADVQSIDLSVLEISFAPPQQHDSDAIPQYKQDVLRVLLPYAHNGKVVEKDKEKSEKIFPAGIKKVEIYSSGDSFEGELNSEGRRHGFGVYTTARNGIREGHGVYTSKDGSRYEGDFKNGKPNGRGTYVFENGDVYTGDFQDDEFHGEGSWSSVDGSNYVGHFENGKRHGMGVMFSKGITYEGVFLHIEDKKSQGYWSNGYFHGRGLYLYANGDLYEGEFRNGKFNGYGRYTTNDGVVIEGDFVDGKPVDTPVEAVKPEALQFQDRATAKERFEKWKLDNTRKIESRKKLTKQQSLLFIKKE